MLLQRKFVITWSNHEKTCTKIFREWLLKVVSGETPTPTHFEEMVTFVDSKVTTQDDDAIVAEYYEEYDTQPVPGDQDSADELH